MAKQNPITNYELEASPNPPSDGAHSPDLSQHNDPAVETEEVNSDLATIISEEFEQSIELLGVEDMLAIAEDLESNARRIRAAVAAIEPESASNGAIIEGQGVYIAAQGETFADVADKMGVSFAVLRSVNPQIRPNFVLAGQGFIIPTTSPAKK